MNEQKKHPLCEKCKHRCDYHDDGTGQLFPYGCGEGLYRVDAGNCGDPWVRCECKEVFPKVSEANHGS